MKFWSESWVNGDPIPAQFAAGRPDGQGRASLGENVNPQLAWSELPLGTQSLVIICHDFDAPTKAEDVNQPGREVPADLARVDFFHWVLVDLPARFGQSGHIGEGQYSRGFVPRGKPGPNTAAPARQGLNDYTSWFAADAELAGSYFGYDGPYPPWNDSLVHHYVFTLYAVSVPKLPVEGAFTGLQVRKALEGRVLAEATLSGTYTLNPRLCLP
jgi:Raf kinase inhibitor-like YbhB/YbcL family protein